MHGLHCCMWMSYDCSFYARARCSPVQQHVIPVSCIDVFDRWLQTQSSAAVVGRVVWWSCLDWRPVLGRAVRQDLWTRSPSQTDCWTVSSWRRRSAGRRRHPAHRWNTTWLTTTTNNNNTNNNNNMASGINLHSPLVISVIVEVTNSYCGKLLIPVITNIDISTLNWWHQFN